MTVIAQDVFTIAMTLMDEQSEDGTFIGYPDEYKKKAWDYLTMLQAELLDPSIPIYAVTDNLNVLQLDDQTCLSVLPYGLAAHLLINEDQNRASFFNARYDELKKRVPYSPMAIQNVYTVDDNVSVSPTADSNGVDGGSFLDPNAGTWDGGEF